MAIDPLAQVLQGYTFDCAEPSCDVCNLGPLPGENRTAWLARLAATVPASLEPIPEPDTPEESLLTDCDRCGEPRWVGYGCQNCRVRTRAARRATA